MLNKVRKNEKRKKRHLRLRNKVQGTPQRPRLNVYRSLKHIYAQIIDDINGNVLCSASSLNKEFKQKMKKGNSREAAKIVGELIAEKAKTKEIEQVSFDRGGCLYHGRLKSLAEAAREKGLNF